ncbi:hypothetical protein [Limnofasciculus baicalensis]|uniref:Uncharacterized protein n=1 Tax=Limnofasciculus baicalensis BBK-W-15 TaxID=2699891 RepID=A0AAE3GYX5_9CYAN|nr:hypothetical protein [Limnofasciculus baicalensis]MCP2732383.1 hypothetical protein [Limnofasciculus baicalensis BBK-W-15]
MSKKKSPIKETAAMNSEAYLYPVVEIMGYKDGHLFPWHIPNSNPFSLIRLSGNMTEEEIGLVFAQLVNYNHLPSGGDTKEVLDSIINSSRLILPGGIQVREVSGKVISPSCCCGLEGWREWLRFLQTGTSPWLGHSPTAWVERVDNLVRVYSSEATGGFHIDFEYYKFKAKLRQVRQDLSDFLLIIEIWAAGLEFPEPQKLSRKFDECFSISHDLSDF